MLVLSTFFVRRTQEGKGAPLLLFVLFLSEVLVIGILVCAHLMFARNKIFMALLLSLPKLMNVLLILLLLLILYSKQPRILCHSGLDKFRWVTGLDVSIVVVSLEAFWV